MRRQVNGFGSDAARQPDCLTGCNWKKQRHGLSAPNQKYWGYHEALPDLVTSSRDVAGGRRLQKEKQRRRERELDEARKLAEERQQKILAQEDASRRLRWLNLACVAIAILVTCTIHRGARGNVQTAANAGTVQ